ncbi:MAG: peptidoglycan DD-metalloendopeptidase family protein [Halioglobus sp.]|nr:peptidoglycan DD-metalloendopeptidase family protein [Halioglobus sp.]
MPNRSPGLRTIACLVLALLLCLPDGSAAQSEEEKARARLGTLEKDIQRINQEISVASTRRNTLQQQLRTAEVELGKLQREASETRASIAANEKEIAALASRQGELETARDTQQARIAQELKSAWQMGGQSQLKLLLNQEDPHTLARIMAYYRYLFAARSELLDAYRKTLAELADVQQQTDASTALLAKREEELKDQQQALISAQGEREIAVRDLSASIDDNAERLKEKEADRQKLEKLLKAIEEAVVNLSVPENYQPFSKARGKMPWPLAGPPSNRFGRPRNEGKMRWQGVTIPAKEGATVRAIHHGRVVYADWLRGSGLLLIIDHGEGYMSLYAHNQTLLKDVGEWVTAGTAVSTVGNTGGQESFLLYFEVRHNGKPVDPAAWCTG